MTEAERKQARELHHRYVQGGVLNEAERVLLQAFLQAVSEKDAAMRAMTTQQQDTRLTAKEERNRKLAALLLRQEQVTQSLRDALNYAETERCEIARERQQIESALL